MSEQKKVNVHNINDPVIKFKKYKNSSGRKTRNGSIRATQGHGQIMPDKMVDKV